MKRTRFLSLNLAFLALLCGRSRSSKNGDCLCSNYPKDLVLCEPGTCNILLSNGMWIGYFSGKLSAGYCPPGYCYYNQSAPYIEISATVTVVNTIDLDNMTCSPMNRSGVLCGKCVTGYGPAVNTYTYPCVFCSNEDKMRNWLYYILAIYVPIVAMFILILLCDVRLTTGAFNAFIVFGQVI